MRACFRTEVNMGAKGSGVRRDLKRMFRNGCEPPTWTLNLGQMQISKAYPTLVKCGMR